MDLQGGMDYAVYLNNFDDPLLTIVENKVQLLVVMDSEQLEDKYQV